MKQVLLPFLFTHYPPLRHHLYLLHHSPFITHYWCLQPKQNITLTAYKSCLSNLNLPPQITRKINGKTVPNDPLDMDTVVQTVAVLILVLVITASVIGSCWFSFIIQYSEKLIEYTIWFVGSILQTFVSYYVPIGPNHSFTSLIPKWHGLLHLGQTFTCTLWYQR